MLGRNVSDTTREKIRLAHLGERSHWWRGDNVGIDGLHFRIRKLLPKPTLCQNCNLVPPFEVICYTGIYDMNLSNWRWWCRRCHIIHSDSGRHRIDMSDRKCSVCGGHKTYIKKNGRPKWGYVDGRLVCKSCREKERYRSRSKQS